MAAGTIFLSLLILSSFAASAAENLWDARNENNDSFHQRDAELFGYADVRCNSLTAASSGPSLIFSVGSEGLYQAF